MGDRIRSEVNKGLAEADQGNVAAWDSEEIKQEGRRLRQEQSQDA